MEWLIPLIFGSLAIANRLSTDLYVLSYRSLFSRSRLAEEELARRYKVTTTLGGCVLIVIAAVQLSATVVEHLAPLPPDLRAVTGVVVAVWWILLIVAVLLFARRLRAYLRTRPAAEAFSSVTGVTMDPTLTSLAGTDRSDPFDLLIEPQQDASSELARRLTLRPLYLLLLLLISGFVGGGVTLVLS